MSVPTTAVTQVTVSTQQSASRLPVHPSNVETRRTSNTVDFFYRVFLDIRSVCLISLSSHAYRYDHHHCIYQQQEQHSEHRQVVIHVRTYMTVTIASYVHILLTIITFVTKPLKNIKALS